VDCLAFCGVLRERECGECTYRVELGYVDKEVQDSEGRTAEDVLQQRLETECPDFAIDDNLYGLLQKLVGE